jgi:hypothetical protein
VQQELSTVSVELDRARKLLREAHSEETMAAAKGQLARLKAEVERLNALQRDSVHVSERDALDSELAQVRRWRRWNAR